MRGCNILLNSPVIVNWLVSPTFLPFIYPDKNTTLIWVDIFYQNNTHNVITLIVLDK